MLATGVFTSTTDNSGFEVFQSLVHDIGAGTVRFPEEGMIGFFGELTKRASVIEFGEVNALRFLSHEFPPHKPDCKTILQNWSVDHETGSISVYTFRDAGIGYGVFVHRLPSLELVVNHFEQIQGQGKLHWTLLPYTVCLNDTGCDVRVVDKFVAKFPADEIKQNCSAILSRTSCLEMMLRTAERENPIPWKLGTVDMGEGARPMAAIKLNEPVPDPVLDGGHRSISLRKVVH